MHRAAVGLLAACALALAAACSGDVIEELTTPLDTPTPTPSASGSSAHALVTADGVALAARLFEADSRHLVLMLHMYPADQAAWFPLARRLRDRGLSALTFDFRGFGQSSGERDPLSLVVDVEAALAFASELGYEDVLLVGASMGGTAAIFVAGTPPRQPVVDAIVAISAPIEFGGLDATAAAAGLGVPLLLVAAEGDTSARESLVALAEAARIPASRRLITSGEAHGTNLLATPEEPGIWTVFVRFIQDIWPDALAPLEGG